jgi:serine/threonine protein kinase/Tol biopolymer transport system component
LQKGLDMRSLIGQTLGGYQITREIGRGGMAVVYEAYQSALSRRVAIKVLPPEMSFDETFVQRFVQEARAAARLSHPNIVTIHDVGRQEGYYYIVMQFLEGEVLSDLIQRAGRLPAERAMQILWQIASALDYAHAHGLVHRDIKPANIIVGAGDHATLTDFGIAKAAESTRLTRTGMLVGTPQYMSPEQASGQPVGPASDLYSLGIVVYQMLAGQVPFQGDSTPALLHRQVYEQPLAVRTYVPGLPEGVDAVLARALAKDPTHRFTSAAAMARALSDALAGRTVPVAAVSAPTQLMAAPLARQKPRLLPILGGLMAVLVVVFGVALLLSRQPRSQPRATQVAIVVSSTPHPSPTPEMSPQRTKGPAEPTTTPGVPRPSPVVPAILARRTVNVYSGPGREFSLVSQLAAGEQLDVVARNSEATWYRVCCAEGEPVWVEASLVDFVGVATDVPVATAVPVPITSTPLRVPETATLPPTSSPLPPTASALPATSTPHPAPTATPLPSLPRVDLAFVGAHSDENGREIYLLYERDSTPHRLTQAPGNDGYPAVSPSRTLIAFEAGRNGDAAGSDIWLMNSDGTNQRRLTSSDGDDAQPAFSPDARTIAFISMRTGTSQIHLMDLKGGNVRHVPAPGWCFAPSFSPDGKQLVFVSTQDSKVFPVFVVNLDGSGLRQVTSEPMHCENPSFTSDGRSIVFDADPAGNHQIFRINADGSGLTNLTSGATNDRQPALSWDGSTIAFTRVTGGVPHIWLMARDGGNPRQLTDLGLVGEVDPAWSR